MKKIFMSRTVLLLLFPVMVLSSCTTNKTDAVLNRWEALINKIEAKAEDKSATKDDMQQLWMETTSIGESINALDKKEITEAQNQRMAELRKKMVEITMEHSRELMQSMRR